MQPKACANPADASTVEPHPLAVPPGRSDLRFPVSHAAEPLSLERARLLLLWLQAQRSVDSRLSELLAAGPAGEQRVRAEIDEVTELVDAAAEAFSAYRDSVLRAGADYQQPEDPARPILTSVPALPRDAPESSPTTAYGQRARGD
jgi:hypothetical protein